MHTRDNVVQCPDRGRTRASFYYAVHITGFLGIELIIPKKIWLDMFGFLKRSFIHYKYLSSVYYVPITIPGSVVEEKMPCFYYLKLMKIYIAYMEGFQK